MSRRGPSRAGSPSRLRTLASRIGLRLLAFNVLLLFLPTAGLLYLDTYEAQLLESQERAMVQQGRLLAAALSGGEALRGTEAERILVELEQRQESRLRVLDAAGRVVADTSRLGPRREAGEEAGGGESRVPASPRRQPLYRLGLLLYRLLTPEPEPPPERPGAYSGDGPLAGPAVREALAGRYGADLVADSSRRSVVLYSAIPVRTEAGEVAGAVLVSRSTARILAALYQVRLGIFQVFLASVGVAAVLSLLLATTIARPLKRLRNQAAALVDRRGRITGRFSGQRRRDEIGDLARALAELTRRLVEHQRFTESFAADVSHELRNPLAGLRTAVEMLSEARDEDEARRFAAMALKEVARLEHLLSAVGEIGRIDAELEGESAETVPVGRLVESLVEGFRLRCPGGPELLWSGPAEELRVQASPDRLAQVVENLLDNAVSFTPPEGRVEVSLERRDGVAVLAVADDGPGIPRGHRERIFERFFSYRPGEPANDGGHVPHSGLGLAIVRAVVERYGGSVTVREANGGGACFEVELPVLGSP